MYSVYGIGNPLMDIITFKDYAVLENLQKPPGSMNLIDADKAASILKMVRKTKDENREHGREEFKKVPGGSCANTIRGLAWIRKMRAIGKLPGISSSVTADSEGLVYSGAVGNDGMGEKYISLMKSYGIKMAAAKKNCASGSSIIIVTPDHERTMFTHLGACREFSADDINFGFLAESRYLYFLGFMWDTDSQKNAIKKAVDFAGKAGIKVCFDLAGPFVVKRYKNEFHSWLPGRIDILLGNREEFQALTDIRSDDREILSASSNMARILILKRGRNGCLVGEHDNTEEILQVTEAKGETVKTVDTTGAGDAFAAGLLYGLSAGRSILSSAKFANFLASQIVTVAGCDYEALEEKKAFQEIVL